MEELTWTHMEKDRQTKETQRGTRRLEKTEAREQQRSQAPGLSALAIQDVSSTCCLGFYFATCPLTSEVLSPCLLLAWCQDVAFNSR